MLIIRQGDQLLLEKRPRDLGRALLLPQVESLAEVEGRLQGLGLDGTDHRELAGFRHTFSHFHPRYPPLC